MIHRDEYGEIHKADGPAVEWAVGSVEWHWHGLRLTFDDWLAVTDRSDEEKVMLKLIWG